MAELPRPSHLGAPSLWDPASPAPSGPRPRLRKFQDVLARWTDGLLYLGTIKKVDSAREVCLVRFEDNSQSWVLWKDISPAALPGEELLCCVCCSETVVPENQLVSCEQCRHVYHQDCHVPRAPAPGEGEGTSWVCRQCVFAIATKRGGALKKGPYARAMQGMKMSLPYDLKGLDWDAGHLSNRQQSYCYCGGPGEWNMKMLQCWRCLQWFHEACTQCLSKPLLYGDRFYKFECCVCCGGPEKVRRLQLHWVDVAHLVLYHLSVSCKKKYFDFNREILPFTSENWDRLLLGELSDTTEGERSSQLLSALNNHKDRFISGREMKKRKSLFGLRTRTPPPVEPITGDGAPTRAGPSGRGLTSPGEMPEVGARTPEEEAEGERGGAGATHSSTQSAWVPGAEGAGSSTEGTAASAAPMVAGKRPGKHPAWDLKGQQCDVNEELKRNREETQRLKQENQGLREQVKEAREQVTVLLNTLEGKPASVPTQPEQSQQKLETLCARVLELEECLGTKERLVQELQKEKLELQEEQKALATRLDTNERLVQELQKEKLELQEEKKALATRLDTNERLVQELQKEKLELQEEQKALATRLEEQEENQCVIGTAQANKK